MREYIWASSAHSNFVQRAELLLYMIYEQPNYINDS